MGAPGAWRPTTVFEGSLRPVRGLPHPITGRGAYKVYAGAAEADARLRIFGSTRIEAGQEAFVRITTTRPLVLDVFDRFVLRESGRQETRRRRLGAGSGAAAARRSLPAMIDLPGAPRRRATTSRRSSPTSEAPSGPRTRSRSPARAPAFHARASGCCATGCWRRPVPPVAHVDAFHRAHPLEEGEPLASARRALADSLKPTTDTAGCSRVRTPDSSEAVLDRLAADGRRHPHEHLGRAPLASTRRPGEGPARPASGRGDLIRTGAATHRQGPRVARDRSRRDRRGRQGRPRRARRPRSRVHFRRSSSGRRSIVAAAGDAGITVSAFREALGTSRKYALPILEWFDQRGVTRREGDLRFPRSAPSGP